MHYPQYCGDPFEMMYYLQKKAEEQVEIQCD